MSMSVIQPHETVRERAIRQVVIPEVRLPCGCWGLEWPLVNILGEHFSWIYCDRCGWMKVTKTGRENMKKEAKKIYAKVGKSKLPLEPPF